MYAWVQGYMSVIESPPVAASLGTDSPAAGLANTTGSISGAHPTTARHAPQHNGDCDLLTLAALCFDTLRNMILTVAFGFPDSSEVQILESCQGVSRAR